MSDVAKILSMLTIAEYMELRCLCGRLRREHAHSYDDVLLPGNVLNPHPSDLHVVGIQNDCRAFTWEMERELSGNPCTNKHLRPLMVEGD
jgi:hypothetical protein